MTRGGPPTRPGAGEGARLPGGATVTGARKPPEASKFLPQGSGDVGPRGLWASPGGGQPLLAPGRQEAWGPGSALAFLPCGLVPGPGPLPASAPSRKESIRPHSSQAGVQSAGLRPETEIQQDRGEARGPWKSPGSRVQAALGLTPTILTSCVTLGKSFPIVSSSAKRELVTPPWRDRWDS